MKIMKKVAFLLVLAITFMSCTHIYFTEPQPAKGKRVTEMPNELHGLWTSSNGTVEFNAAGVTIMEIKEDTIENSTETYVDYEYLNLSEDFQLFQVKDLYVFNLKDDDTGYWEYGVLQKQVNGDINYYQNNNPDYYAKAKGLKFVEAGYMDYESGEEKKLDKIDSDSELDLQYVLFSGKISYKSLKKTIVKENLSTIYREDGTVYTVEEEVEEE